MRLNFAFCLFCVHLPATYSFASTLPNIILIVADDLGYGDIGCYGATAIPTPHLDQLCARSLRLSRCYASASTCTPTRYSMLTGRYAFRPTKHSTSILDGDAPLAIEPGTPSLPKILQDAGYHTVLVGKWHLGIGNGQEPVDWNGHVGPGPLEVGFDHAFYIPATVDRVPCVFIENHKVFRHDPNDPIEVSYQHSLGDDPIAREHPELLKYTADEQHSDVIVNGVGRIGYMSGGSKARWVDGDITDVLAMQAREAILHGGGKPLFLLLGTHDPHKPHLPHDRFTGKSQCGRRGDSIVQFDWLVGQVIDALRDSGVEQDTFVFVTSDNGPAIYDGYNDGALETLGAHRPAGPLRGLKYSVYEGGCRVPGIVCWPGVIEPGSSEVLISLLDLYATLPRIAGIDQLPDNFGCDAIDFSEVLLGKVSKSPREFLVLQGIGSAKSIVSRQWKYIPSTHVRQTSSNGPAHGKATRWADVPIYETALYDLNNDVSEQENVIERYPLVAEKMRTELDRTISQEPKLE